MTTLYVDESKRSNYVLVAAAVPDESAEETRRLLRRHVLSGQRRLHFSHESDSRRRAILAEVGRAGLRAHLMSSKAHPEWRARGECLSGLVEIACQTQARRIVLELDESLAKSDRRTLFRELDRRGARDSISYALQPAHSEPLLWAADAIAWSWARGGDWRRRIEPLIAERIRYLDR